jgi:hypothetical protein
MIDIKNIATNLVQEAVKSTVKEGRPAGKRNLTFDGSVGSNADQLFLRYGRALTKNDNELALLGDKISLLANNMTDEEIERAASDETSELYQLTKQYNELDSQGSALEKIMTKYAQEYKANDGTVSPETRAELRNFDPDEKNRYNTDLYQKSLDKLKKALQKYGMNRNSFDTNSVDGTDPKMKKWIAKDKDDKEDKTNNVSETDPKMQNLIYSNATEMSR